MAARVHQDGLGPDGEHRGEADAELADLGEVSFFVRGEHARELLIDDRLVHPLAKVVHVDLEHAVIGLVAQPDFNPGRACVDAVLHQLAQKIHGPRELMDQVVESLASQVGGVLGFHARSQSGSHAPSQK